MTVFVSDAIEGERLPFATGPAGRSSPRSWKVLAGLYRSALAASGERVVPLLRPEIYQSAAARQVLGVGAADWHLAIKPIGHLRPFHGIPTVFLCDGGFRELSSTDADVSPFLDEVGMLKKADVVACCTDFTADNLRRAGIETVATWPPFVPIRERRDPFVVPAVRALPLAAILDAGAGPAVPLDRSLADLRARGRIVFLSIVDTAHLPSQMGGLIEGFLAARAENPNLALVVKLVSDGRDAETSAPKGLLPDLAPGMKGMPSEILVVRDPLDEDGLADLIGSADAYLCCSSAEGMNLPLITAMQAGVPIVATMNSATGSYLTPDAAIPIPTHPGIVDRSDDAIAPNPAAIRDAVLAAVSLDPATRARMVQAARDIAARSFGQDAFEAGLGRVRALVARSRRR